MMTLRGVMQLAPPCSWLRDESNGARHLSKAACSEELYTGVASPAAHGGEGSAARALVHACFGVQLTSFDPFFILVDGGQMP